MATRTTDRLQVSQEGVLTIVQIASSRRHSSRQAQGSWHPIGDKRSTQAQHAAAGIDCPRLIYCTRAKVKVITPDLFDARSLRVGEKCALSAASTAAARNIA